MFCIQGPQEVTWCPTRPSRWLWRQPHGGRGTSGWIWWHLEPPWAMMFLINWLHHTMGPWMLQAWCLLLLLCFPLGWPFPPGKVSSMGCWAQDIPFFWGKAVTYREVKSKIRRLIPEISGETLDFGECTCLTGFGGSKTKSSSSLREKELKAKSPTHRSRSKVPEPSRILIVLLSTSMSYFFVAADGEREIIYIN